MPKLVPPKIDPAGLILAKKSAKTGPLDHFCCQNWSGQTNFGCQKWSSLAKISPHGGPILAKNYLPKSVPPQSGTLIPACTWLHGCSYYAPIIVTPHPPQVGQRWGLVGICKSYLINSPPLGTILCYKSPIIPLVRGGEMQEIESKNFVRIEV